MECGRIGVDGLLAQGHATEGRGKDLVHARIQSPYIRVENVMEETGRQMIATIISVLILVSQVRIQNLECNHFLALKRQMA